MHCLDVCSAGTRGKSSNHGEELFICQEKVDALLANYSKRPRKVCEQKEFFSYFVCSICCFTLTFCYPSVLIPQLETKVTVMFIACSNDVSVDKVQFEGLITLVLVV